MAEPVLAVNEIFSTLQGEGPSIGKPAVFLRLAGCDLACAWCDTPYSWDWKGVNGKAFDPKKEITRMTVEQVGGKLRAKGADTRIVVITGGEPLLQDRALTPLLEMLHARNIPVEIETNGRRAPRFSAELATYNVSPKLTGSRNVKQTIVPSALEWFRYSERAIFKFVVSNYNDILDVIQIVDEQKLDPHRVYLMAVGATRERQIEKLQWLEIQAKSLNMQVTPRLHILVHGDVRGV